MKIPTAIPAKVRRLVRERANYACEYCGVSETDSGGELTIDHYRPQVQGGLRDADNLIYACPRCNQYKSDYWPSAPDAPALWNPRRESAELHFSLKGDGKLIPLTPTGVFTLKRLRLNRPAPVAHRLRETEREERTRQWERQAELIALLRGVLRQHETLLQEQQTLLET